MHYLNRMAMSLNSKQLLVAVAISFFLSSVPSDSSVSKVTGKNDHGAKIIRSAKCVDSVIGSAFAGLFAGLSSSAASANQMGLPSSYVITISVAGGLVGLLSGAFIARANACYPDASSRISR